jgi:hypothetical protein
VQTGITFIRSDLQHRRYSDEQGHRSHVCFRRPGSRGYRTGHPGLGGQRRQCGTAIRRPRCRESAGWDQGWSEPDISSGVDLYVPQYFCPTIDSMQS